MRPTRKLESARHLAGDARDEGTLSLLAVVGQAQAMDVLEQAHPQAVQRLLAAHPEPLYRRALGDGGDDDDGQPDHAEDGDRTDVDLVLLQPPVDGLLRGSADIDLPIQPSPARTSRPMPRRNAGRVDPLADHLHGVHRLCGSSRITAV